MAPARSDFGAKSKAGLTFPFRDRTLLSCKPEMKLNFHFLPLTSRLVSYTPGRECPPTERFLALSPLNAGRTTAPLLLRASPTGHGSGRIQDFAAAIGQGRNEACRFDDTELDLNSAERALLEDFFKLLDVWDSEDSGGDTNPSRISTRKCQPAFAGTVGRDARLGWRRGHHSPMRSVRKAE